MRMAVCPCQTVRAAPAGPVVLDGGDDGAGAFRLAEGDEDLIQHDLVEDGVACVAQTLGEARRLAAVALDHLGQPRATQRLQRGPDLDATRAAREFRREL